MRGPKAPAIRGRGGGMAFAHAPPMPTTSPVANSSAPSRPAEEAPALPPGGKARKASASLAAGAARLPLPLPAGVAGKSAPTLMRAPSRPAVLLPRLPPAMLRGYAAAATQAAAKAAAKTGASTKKSEPGTSTRGEWGFLNDSKLSIEDKLFLFMKLVQKKNDQELNDKMREYRDKYVDKSSSSSSTSKTTEKKTDDKGSGGLLGVLGSVFKSIPPFSLLSGLGIDLGDLVGKLLGSLGPQLLSALTIPLGVPWAAPIVEQLASKALPSLLEGKSAKAASTAEEKSSSASGSGKAGTPDEKLEMLEIQRLVEKQNQMFTCISNVLKTMHDTAMGAIHNMR